MGSWTKPVPTHYKLNVKGIFNRPSMQSVVRCVLRDARGAWKKGCGGLIGLAVRVTSQLWSIFYGLKLAWENDYTSLILETDCDEALAHILHPDPLFPLSDLVTMINNLREEALESLQLEVISNSANNAAIALSTHCIVGPGGVDEITSPPQPVRAVIAEEGDGHV